MLHNSKKETILKEEVHENILAIYLDDEPINYIPEKDSGYTLDLTKSSCNNGAMVSWNDETWSVSVNFSNYQAEDISRTKCTLYFTEQNEYTQCVNMYGEASANCKIIADLDTTDVCPPVNDDGSIGGSLDNVGGDFGENVNSYVCSAPDDYGTSYYFRGNVENNYVKFAGFYWRIIRLNGDGSIRMIYAGDADMIDALDNKEEVLSNGYDDSNTDYTQIGVSAFNVAWKNNNALDSSTSSVSNDNAGVGYMYGNRDNTVEGTTELRTVEASSSETVYVASSYEYNFETNTFSPVNPVAVKVSDLDETYVGYYAPSPDSSYIYRITSITPGNLFRNTVIGYTYVRYGTTSKEKAQENINNSTIKDVIDAWYEENLLNTEYEEYLSDTLFCNDRSLSSNIDSTYTQLGYGVEKTGYRMRNSLSVTLKCNQQNDRFTVNDEAIGNGDLTYPIALMTIDEAYFAGASITEGKGHYLYTGNDYWAMNATEFSGWGAIVEKLSNIGSGSNGEVQDSYGVRPVINLKANSLQSGDGTINNPYMLSEN